MATAQSAFDSARSYLNDSNKQIWTNTTLLPYLQEAYRDLLLQLWLNGLPVIREKSASINVNAGTLNLGGNLPADIFEPIWLKERAQGSSEDWQAMTEVDFEPDWPQDTTLRYWTWRKEDIRFLGATTNRSVLLQYYRGLTIPTSIADPSADVLGFLFAEMFLGPQTAGYAAGSVGNLTLAGELVYIQGKNVGVAGSKLDMLIRANVKGQQNLPARRIPYRRFARSRLLL